MRKQMKERKEKMILLAMGLILGLAAYNIITALTPILGLILLVVDFIIFCFYEDLN